MTTDRQNNDEAALEALFDAARDDREAPDADFMARLAADAAAEVRPFEWAAPRTARKGGISHAFGRWFAALALAGSTALGVWIGFTSPDLLNEAATVAALDDGMAISDFLAGADFDDVFAIGGEG